MESERVVGFILLPTKSLQSLDVPRITSKEAGSNVEAGGRASLQSLIDRCAARCGRSTSRLTRSGVALVSTWKVPSQAPKCVVGWLGQPQYK